MPEVSASYAAGSWAQVCTEVPRGNVPVHCCAPVYTLLPCRLSWWLCCMFWRPRPPKFSVHSQPQDPQVRNVSPVKTKDPRSWVHRSWDECLVGSKIQSPERVSLGSNGWVLISEVALY